MAPPGRLSIRILFISANRIGDAVISCGVIDALVRRYPQARFTIACGPAAEGVFARMPNRERTILVEKHKSDSHWWRLWTEVAFTWWDLVVDIRGSAIAYVLPARRRVVRRRRPGRMFEQHGAMLGIDPPPLPIVWTAAEDRARAAALLPAGRPVVGLGVTANWHGKVWPADRFAALFHRLADGPLPGAVPAVFAGPGAAERAMADPTLALLPDAIDLCGALTLPEAAACIQRCALYVGNDSGLMHLAAACGTPTIGLCAATNDRAEEMSPAGLYAAWALSQGSDMRDLTVETAFDACLAILRDAGGPVAAGQGGDRPVSHDQ